MDNGAPSSNSPAEPTSEITERERRALQVVQAVSTKRANGEEVDEQDVIDANPDIRDELMQAFLTRREIRQTMLSARRGHISSSSVANAPIDLQSQSQPPTGSNMLAIRGYRQIRALRTGGQASIYQATQESTGRPVALKVIAGGPYLNKRGRVRFDREVKILATLKHPGIVQIIDSGRTDDGSFYFAMEFIDGLDLDEYLGSMQRVSSDQNEVLRLFGRIADSLEEAHCHGIVHRDLKPSNIRIDKRGQPHLLDFGLAQIRRDAASRRLNRTITFSGNVIGSMPWTSPEQAAGRIRAINPATDVYSLGVMLYRALTGKAPYNVVGMLHEVTKEICSTPPVQPQTVPNPPFGRIDAPLAHILLTCLAKTPDERYQSAGALRDILGQYLTGALHERHRANRRRKMIRAMVGTIASGLVVWAALLMAPPINSDTPQPVTLLHVRNSIGMDLVRLPGGRFVMGSSDAESGREDNEEPHVVQLSRSFLISSTETTCGQYRQVMGALPKECVGREDDMPVEFVTWDNAVEFCRRLSQIERSNYRLPTEAEWEYACRAGGQRLFGEALKVDTMGWYLSNSGGTAHRVAQKASNRFALYDMVGNVSEWCSDSYTHFLGSERKTDPIFALGPEARVIRGGNFSDTATDCRAARRRPGLREMRAAGLGFRVVQSQPPMESSTAAPKN